jgi:AbrB family looped-hinge helix DNA binding protein
MARLRDTELMSLPQSKVTTTGWVTIPAEIRRKLGIGPGSILEWVEDGEAVIVRKVRYSFEDIHRAVFAKPPEPRTLEELKQSIVDHLRDKHSRD